MKQKGLKKQPTEEKVIEEYESLYQPHHELIFGRCSNHA